LKLAKGWRKPGGTGPMVELNASRIGALRLPLFVGSSPTLLGTAKNSLFSRLRQGEMA